MDFKDELKQLAERVVKLKERIQTEEATKNAFIMPFIQCLGYDVFNPLEVVPEYVADIGIKKGNTRLIFTAVNFVLSLVPAARPRYGHPLCERTRTGRVR